MSLPTSYVSQRDAMNARMATKAPSEVELLLRVGRRAPVGRTADHP
jgi:hypothetical protein